MPSVIPKGVRKFYSDAIVAYQSGQVLPGLFMLRTLIEQWARQSLGPEKLADLVGSGRSYADQIMDAYMDSLPPPVRDHFPSMRVLYGDISADLHNAAANIDLFDRALHEVDEHFQARNLFKLPT